MVEYRPLKAHSSVKAKGILAKIVKSYFFRTLEISQRLETI